jgi:G6PDH family F420-dependent oxidoreductase
VGTGENLNEHILGDKWSPYEVRADMLAEAVEVIRLLWEGGEQSFYGEFYTVENARIYTLPEVLPQIMVAAAGPQSAELAADIGDGLISTAPDKELVQAYQQAGGSGNPRYGQITICWAESEKQGVKTAYEIWPVAGVKGQLMQELPTPALFEQAAEMVTEEQIAETVICGNDVKRHLEGIQKYIDAGFDHVYIHQLGHDQEGFFRFYQQHILPEFQAVRG